MVHAVRTKLPRVLAASAAACLLWQGPVAAAPDGSLQARKQQTERRGERIDDRLESTRDRLAENRAEQQHTRSTLQRIDGEQTALAAELAKLETRLSAAEDELRAAETVLRRTRAEISHNRNALQATARALDEGRQLLAERTRRSYMHGGVSYPEAMLDIETANDLGTSLQYMQTIMEVSQDRVEHISALEREHEAMLERLDELERVQNEARAERASRRDEVASLVAGKREVEAQLRAREDEHRTLLAELDSNADRYRAAIDDLEAEGRAIEKRLADISARQRRAETRGGAASTGAASTRAVSTRSGSSLQWPVNGVITSSYGYRTHPVLGYSRLHSGTDFGAASGTPIVAADGGVVVTAGWLGGYGNTVVVSHGGGMATLYAHQSRLAVGTGTRVSRGQVIGYVGSTGMSTGPHLHFEVRINGATTDPARYL